MGNPTADNINFAESYTESYKNGKKPDVSSLVLDAIYEKHAEWIKEHVGSSVFRSVSGEKAMGLKGTVVQSANGKVTLGLKDLDKDGRFDYVDVIMPESGWLVKYNDFATVSSLQQELPNKGIPSRK